MNQEPETWQDLLKPGTWWAGAVAAWAVVQFAWNKRASKADRESKERAAELAAEPANRAQELAELAAYRDDNRRLRTELDEEREEHRRCRDKVGDLDRYVKRLGARVADLEAALAKALGIKPEFVRDPEGTSKRLAGPESD